MSRAKAPKTRVERLALRADETEAARRDPERVARYLAWWVARPSRWLINLRPDCSEMDLPKATDAPDYYADEGAFEVAIERGYLVLDPREDCSGWELSEAGRRFATGVASTPEPDQLGLFEANHHRAGMTRQ